MQKQESKLLTLKALQCLSIFFSKLFEYLGLGFITVFLIYCAKVSHVNISWTGEFITNIIELSFVVFMGAFVISFTWPNKYLSNFSSKLIDFMLKSGYVLYLVNEYGGLSANVINDKSTGLGIIFIIVLLAKWLFNFARKYYSNVLVGECIDLNYIKLKDYKVNDNFIADDYKNVQVDSQSLAVALDGSGMITHANGYVIFKVAKLPVTLTFTISPFMSGRLVNDEETYMLSAVRVEPKFVAKQVDRAIKL